MSRITPFAGRSSYRVASLILLPNRTRLPHRIVTEIP